MVTRGGSDADGKADDLFESRAALLPLAPLRRCFADIACAQRLRHGRCSLEGCSPEFGGRE
jgi:hypothetical protein